VVVNKVIRPTLKMTEGQRTKRASLSKCDDFMPYADCMQNGAFSPSKASKEIEYLEKRQDIEGAVNRKINHVLQRACELRSSHIDCGILPEDGKRCNIWREHRVASSPHAYRHNCELAEE